MNTPTISILVVTYNRSQIVRRAVDSILAQTYQDFEIILVNNGSTDNTSAVLAPYLDNEKIRYFTISENKGAAAGFNFAFDQIQGEWFTLLPDDDVLLPSAFETLLKIPQNIDPTITAVTCNCIDSSTRGFSGYGLYESQFLDLEKIVKNCSGEFYGITKTELLGNKRLNVDLIGYEDSFWYQIDAIAKRYYLHEAHRIYSTEIDPLYRISMTNESHQRNIKRKVQLYSVLLHEDFYWKVTKKYNLKEFLMRSFYGWFFLHLVKDKEGSQGYAQKLAEIPGFNKYKLFSMIFTLMGTKISKFLYVKKLV